MDIYHDDKAQRADEGYRELSRLLGGSLADGDPTVLGRAIVAVLGQPVFVEYTEDQQQYPCGLSYGRPHPFIEVKGGRHHYMLPFVMLHEMAHALLHPVFTTAPALHKEYQADLWALNAHKGLFMPKHEEVEADAKLRMRNICQEWWEADLLVHPVPDVIAEWCGWEKPPLRKCTRCGEGSRRIPEGETLCSTCYNITEWEKRGTQG